MNRREPLRCPQLGIDLAETGPGQPVVLICNHFVSTKGIEQVCCDFVFLESLHGACCVNKYEGCEEYERCEEAVVAMYEPRYSLQEWVSLLVAVSSSQTSRQPALLLPSTQSTSVHQYTGQCTDPAFDDRRRGTQTTIL